MSTSTATGRPSTSLATTPQFWERLWRTAGMQSVGLFIVAYFVYGDQPYVGASAEALVAFYQGDSMRILIAAVLAGLAVLNLMWFAAALRTTLAEAGQDGWGAAATASSAALGGLLMLLVTVCAGLAYSIAGSKNPALMAGLNDFAWAGVVLSSFPRAMLIMSAAFWTLASRTNLEPAARGRRCDRCVRSAARDHVDQRRILGARWGLFPVRLAAYRPPMDHGRQPRPLDPRSSYARMVITAMHRRTELRKHL